MVGLAATTVARYTTMIERFNGTIWSVARTSLHSLLAAGDPQPVAILGVLFVQMGYDTGLFGLGDIANFVAGLKKVLEDASLKIEGVTFGTEQVLAPIRKVYAKWREIEPYDYKLPVAEEVTLALLGLAVASCDFEMVTYLVVCNLWEASSISHCTMP
jgi:hypothetical protein